MSKAPLHKNISDWIKERIQTKELDIDDKIPSENELAAQFDVSRLTVRRALQTLEQEDLIIRAQGLGAFVKAPKPETHQIHQSPLSNSFKKQGIQSEVVLIGKKVTEARPAILEILKLNPYSKIYEIELVQNGEGQPYAFDRFCMSMMYGQLFEDSDVENERILSILTDKHQIEIVSGCQRFDAIIADSHLSSILNIEIGSPLLTLKRVFYTQLGQVAFYHERIMRTDRLTYQMQIEKKNRSDFMIREIDTVLNVEENYFPA